MCDENKEVLNEETAPADDGTAMPQEAPVEMSAEEEYGEEIYGYTIEYHCMVYLSAL